MKDVESSKLNTEQTEFAAQNEGLIWGFIRENKLDDDFYFIIALDFLKAVMNYDSGRGVSFSTFAHKYMLNAMKKEFQCRNYQKRKLDYSNELLSLDYEYRQADESVTSLSELISDNTDIFRIVEVNEIINYIIENARTDKAKDIIRMRLAGYEYVEIAKKHGTTYQNVQKIVLRLFKMAKEKYKNVYVG